MNRERIAELLIGHILGNEWIPHTPYAKQSAFLVLDDKEALYGGAAGGGKSDALLMAALMYVDTPGYNAIIFRKTYSDLALPEAVMARSHEWLRPWKTNQPWDATAKECAFMYILTGDLRYALQAKRAVLAVCGGTGKARALRAIRRAFGEWQAGSAVTRSRPLRPKNSRRIVIARASVTSDEYPPCDGMRPWVS